MITLVDFNDSFTYNIAAVVAQMGFDIEILSHEKIDHIRPLKERQVVILGPGPGHPREYPKASAFIQKYLGQDSIFFMGVCLGHQLIFHAKGSKIEKSHRPLHGQSELITIPHWSQAFTQEDFSQVMEVQRYNSLCVKNYNFEAQVVRNKSEEIVMATGPGFFSCQFHPESIGTSCPKSFFHSLVNYLYNKRDGSNNEARGPL